MGASNFCYNNTSKLYVFAMNDEDSDPFGYDDAIDNVRCAISKMNGFQKGWGKFPTYRSYPEYIIGTVSSDESIAGRNISVLVTVLARSGYYHGACFDYHFWIEVDGCECEMEEIIDAQAIEWIEKTRDGFVFGIELVFDMYCSDKLMVLGTFSNGETLYKSVD